MVRTRTTAPKTRKRYVTASKGDDVCPIVRVSFMGFWDGTNRVIGNRSRSLGVPEARVSEVYELVAAALAGLVGHSSRECDSEAKAELDEVARGC